MRQPFIAHPWHGVPLGERAPHEVNAFIEIVPTDVVKYEIDKQSGILRVDRPNKYSSQCPSLYGFLPQTYFGEEVGKYCAERTGRAGIIGDGDPLDVCVLCERPIQHGAVLLTAVPIGGFCLIDRGQADDKIVAVLLDDAVYGAWKDISACQARLIDRLKHYFLTYKEMPGEAERRVEIASVYGAEEARQVILHSRTDYQRTFG